MTHYNWFRAEDRRFYEECLKARCCICHRAPTRSDFRLMPLRVRASGPLFHTCEGLEWHQVQYLPASVFNRDHPLLSGCQPTDYVCVDCREKVHCTTTVQLRS